MNALLRNSTSAITNDYLGVHSEMSHQMDVADLVLVRDGDSFSSWYQLVGHDLPHHILIEGKREPKVRGVAIIVLQIGEIAVQLRVQRWQLIHIAVQGRVVLAQDLREQRYDTSVLLRAIDKSWSRTWLRKNGAKGTSTTIPS